MFESLFESLIDVLFPRRCYGCDTYLLGTERGCCGACGHTVHEIESPRCPRCGLPRQVRAGVDELCGDCLSRPPAFDQVEARWVYDGAVADAIRRSKAGGDPSSLLTLAGEATRWCQSIAEGLDAAHWTTPPVHPRDLARRGWDPARMVARQMFGALGVRFDDPLSKCRRTVKQASLGRDARRAALRGAFECGGSVDGTWVVVDDVMTTGATLHEAARALKRAGAVRVIGVVLARSV